MKNVIPILGVPLERFNVNLNGTLYTFFIAYNARGGFWTISLLVNDVPLFEGFKAVQGVDIGGLYNLNIGGRLYIESITDDLSDPTRDNFGNDMRLIYDDSL
jgi:hypothetical protein